MQAQGSAAGRDVRHSSSQRHSYSEPNLETLISGTRNGGETWCTKVFDIVRYVRYVVGSERKIVMWRSKTFDAGNEQSPQAT